MPISGANLIAHSLVALGVKHIFGIVGIPVIEVADACIAQGIQFVAFRNEQAASYAASIYGYLTGLPGVCLVVGGPGVLHALAGVGNATSNNLPLLLLAGSSETHQAKKGAFQELDQVSLLAPHTKLSVRPSALEALPKLLEQAYRVSYFGRPGPTYIDLPGDFIKGSLDDVSDISKVPELAIKPPGAAPKPAADPARVAQAVALLAQAKNPLIIVGKGAAYAFAESSIRDLHDFVQFPFLPTPMGKGVIPDGSPLNVSAARSAALKTADVVLLLGARLNWILHYGEAPKYAPNVQFIQVDIAAEELGSNAAQAELSIVGDVGLVAQQLLQAFKAHRPQGYPKQAQLPAHLEAIKQKNTQKATKTDHDTAYPIKYQPVYRVIREAVDAFVAKTATHVVYVSEGANTMDISRSSFPLQKPRTRLDAGTNATMGVGLGYALAAKAADPRSLVVAIEGDSAFGFSAIEVETAVRSNLPVIIVVMNNSGVYHGVDPDLYKTVDTKPLPSTALQLETKYHLLAEALGATGYEAHTLEEVKTAFEDALANRHKTSVINVIIDVGKDKKLEFGWMASTKKAAKL